MDGKLPKGWLTFSVAIRVNGPFIPMVRRQMVFVTINNEDQIRPTLFASLLAIISLTPFTFLPFPPCKVWHAQL